MSKAASDNPSADTERRLKMSAGDHALQVRNGRNLSRTLTFDAAEGQVVAFRCTGKRFLPIFLVSFVVPSLALSLRPE